MSGKPVSGQLDVDEAWASEGSFLDGALDGGRVKCLEYGLCDSSRILGSPLFALHFAEQAHGVVALVVAVDGLLALSDDSFHFITGESLGDGCCEGRRNFLADGGYLISIRGSCVGGDVHVFKFAESCCLFCHWERTLTTERWSGGDGKTAGG